MKVGCRDGKPRQVGPICGRDPLMCAQMVLLRFILLYPTRLLKNLSESIVVPTNLPLPCMPTAPGWLPLTATTENGLPHGEYAGGLGKLVRRQQRRAGGIRLLRSFLRSPTRCPKVSTFCRKHNPVLTFFNFPCGVFCTPANIGSLAFVKVETRESQVCAKRVAADVLESQH